MLPAGAGLQNRFQSPRTLAERAAREATLPVAALIFHCSRCGSTLLARLLELDAANRVFAEPEALPKFLGAHADALRRGEATTELRHFIQAFGFAPGAGERRLVLKLTSRSIAYLPAFRAAFPHAPCFYLYRRPDEVVASLFANPPPFLRDEYRSVLAGEFDAASPDVSSHGRVEWLAWYVSQNLRMAWKNRECFAGTIDHSEYRTGYLGLLERIGGGLPAPTDVQRILQRHSKDPTMLYQPMPAPKLTPAQRQAVAATVGDAYDLWHGREGCRHSR